MEALSRQLRLSARTLRRAPAFSLATTATLALALAGPLVVGNLSWSIPRSIVRNADRLHELRRSGANWSVLGVPAPALPYLTNALASVEEIAVESNLGFVAEDGRPDQLNVSFVSPNYFGFLGVTP